ncbi:MAG: hypothetical protein MK132_14905 [Lentisphaerales bacterium]|nr:hypothetical protein [Lentisphaerales bacterium]
MKKSLAFLALGLLTSCQTTEWQLKQVKIVEGMDVPESAVYDEKSDLVYVSNMETSTKGFWENDGKSFITAMTPEGNIVNRRWLDSKKGATLNSLKGLTILNGYIYFADNTQLKRTSLKKPGKVEVFDMPGAQKLNDLGNDGKAVLVTDTAQSAIYRFFPETRERTMIKSPKVVNGVTYANGKYYAVSFGEHEVYELDATGEKEPVPFGLADKFTNLDGIEVLKDGSFLISDVKGNAIFTVSPDRKTVKKLAELPWAADIALDRERSLLYVPSLLTKRVYIYKLEEI